MGILFNPPQKSTGMSSSMTPSMSGDQHTFDSSAMNYGSGEPTRQLFGSAPTTNTDHEYNPAKDGAGWSANQTDGTLLGTSGQVGGSQPAMGSREWVQNYYDSRGVKPSGNSVDYWANKSQEDWAKKDPAFYQKFLSNAEEFTGGAAQTAAAMGWGNGQNSGQQGQANGFNMQQMLPMLMQLMQQGGQKSQVMPQQQVSNGALFNAQDAGTPQMDISSFLG